MYKNNLINDICKLNRRYFLKEYLKYYKKDFDFFEGDTLLHRQSIKLKNKNILSKYNLPSSFLKILDQKVLHNGINISGGQKRMVHILRAILHHSPIVILDEPTDSLDEKSTIVIIELIRELIKKKTVICISHDNRLKSVFTRSIEL